MKPGKIDASLNERLEKVEWGKYKLGDLFEINSSKKIFHANYIDKIFDEQIKNTLPYIVRTTQKNGTRGYIVEDLKNANDGNTLSFAQDTFSVFYQKQKYFTGNKVKILKAKFEKNTGTVMKYMAASFQKSLNSLTWGVGSTIDSIAETEISLPTKDGKIDFDFMENFIDEIEKEKIERLNNYLEVTGLKDCNLTSEEEKVLEDFENNKFENFNVVDIFNVKNSGNILSRDIIENSGRIPYLGAGSENNSVSSYISYDEKYLDQGNCIFIGGKTFVVSYQEKDFFSNDSHNLVLQLKDRDKRNKLNQLFLATSVNRGLGYKYSWGDSISNRKIQKDTFSLPTKNSEPDYRIMETLISAVQKMVIKDVVKYGGERM